MCHSVEMYLPRITRDAAEHRLGQADFAAAERERHAVEAGRGLWEWLVRRWLVGRWLDGAVRRPSIEVAGKGLNHG